MMLIFLLACSEHKVVPCTSDLEIKITDPLAGSVFSYGALLELQAIAKDPCGEELEDAEITLSSNIDQELDIEYIFDDQKERIFFDIKDVLSVGAQQLQLLVVQNDGSSGTDGLEIEIVENTPPEIILNQPQDAVFQDLARVQVSVYDAEDREEDLLLSWKINDVVWDDGPAHADEQGDLSFEHTFEAGCYQLSVEVTDSAGESASATGGFVLWTTEEELSAFTWYADVDGDGWGEEGAEMFSCESLEGYVPISSSFDCAPENPEVYPGAPDYCNDGLDSDCSVVTPTDCYPLGEQMSSTAGAIFEGSGGGFLGSDVTALGDWNGDSYDDLAISADGLSHVYLIDGPIAGNQDLTDEDGFRCRLAVNYAQSKLGDKLLGQEDWNDDGFPDLLIGAHRWSESTFPNPGAVFLLFGGDNSFDCEGTLNLDYEPQSFSTGGQIRISGEVHNAQLGSAITIVPDISGDGRSELLLGASGDNEGGDAAGAAYLIYSSDLSLFEQDAVLEDVAHLKLIGDQAYDKLAATVSAADLDGDGKGDLILGSPEYSLDLDQQGRIQIVYGRDVPLVSSNFSMSSILGLSFYGVEEGAKAGSDIELAGDLDGDGDDELFVVSSGAMSGSGTVHIVPGFYENGGQYLLDDDIGELFSPSARSAYVMHGQVGDQISEIHRIPDINTDGNDEFVVGAPFNSLIEDQAGAAYLLYGGDYFWNAWWDSEGEPLSSINLYDEAILAERTAIFQGERANRNFGRTVKAAGDMNADGFNDVVVAEDNYDAKVYLFWGGGH
ncbi:MAG: hypothetical protein CMK59_06570 [Proteobacteria bacterium]|nr:hypothetical protein [Pseudomonadota bacterium]